MDDATIVATSQRPNEATGPDEHGSWVPAWTEIGRANPWVKYACDPQFSEAMFHECADADELQPPLPWVPGAVPGGDRRPTPHPHVLIRLTSAGWRPAETAR